MNRFRLSAVVLFALAAKAQNINFQGIQHIHTSLNHLTVIDLGEPIQFIAAADPDSFQIERAGDKVLLQPLKDAIATNLIVWTASRQISYELDAPGDVTSMNVLVRNLPPSVRATASLSTAKEQQQIATAATTQAMLDTQDIVADRAMKPSSTGISVTITRVLHTTDGTYLQYQVVNHSTAPFRVTTPLVTRLVPTQTPISLLALKNHELTLQTLSSFKAKPDGSLMRVVGQSAKADIPSGTSTTGYVLVPQNSGTTPVIYQLNFGSSATGSLVETVVI